MVNQQKKPQPQQCEHTLQRGPNAGCRCATKTSFVNALGLRLCSKHKAAAPQATQHTPLDLAALPGDALTGIMDHGLDPKARRLLAQTCMAHRTALEPCRVLDMGLVVLASWARPNPRRLTGVGFEGLWSSEKLVIKERLLEDCHGVALAEVLRRNTRLVWLELNGCTQTSSFVTHLAGALVTNTTLRDLRITGRTPTKSQGSFITPRWALRKSRLMNDKLMILAKSLEANTGLVTVDLSNNLITWSRTALETALKVNQTLKKIWLCREYNEFIRKD